MVLRILYVLYATQSSHPAFVQPMLWIRVISTFCVKSEQQKPALLCCRYSFITLNPLPINSDDRDPQSLPPNAQASFE